VSSCCLLLAGPHGALITGSRQGICRVPGSAPTSVAPRPSPRAFHGVRSSSRAGALHGRVGWACETSQGRPYGGSIPEAVPGDGFTLHPGRVAMEARQGSMITVLTTVTTALGHENDGAAVWRDARPVPSAAWVPRRPVVAAAGRPSARHTTASSWGSPGRSRRAATRHAPVATRRRKAWSHRPPARRSLRRGP